MSYINRAHLVLVRWAKVPLHSRPRVLRPGSRLCIDLLTVEREKAPGRAEFSPSGCRGKRHLVVAGWLPAQRVGRPQTLKARITQTYQ